MESQSEDELQGVLERARQLRIAPYGTWRYACGTYTISRSDEGPLFKEVCSVGCLRPYHNTETYIWKTELTNSGNVLEFILTRGSQELQTVFTGTNGSGKRIKHAAILLQENKQEYELHETFRSWEACIRNIAELGVTNERGSVCSTSKAIGEVLDWVDEYNDIWSILWEKGNELFDDFMKGLASIGIDVLRKHGNSSSAETAHCLHNQILRRRGFISLDRPDVVETIEKFCAFFAAEDSIPCFLAFANPAFQDWLKFCAARENVMDQCKETGDVNSLTQWLDSSIDTEAFQFKMPARSEADVEHMQEKVRRRRFAMLAEVEEWEKKVATQMDTSSPQRLKDLAKAFQEVRMKEESNLSLASDRYEAVVTPAKIKAAGGIKNTLTAAGVKAVAGMDEEQLEFQYAKLKQDLFRAREVAAASAAKGLTPGSHSVQQLARAMEANAVIKDIAETALPALLQEEQCTVDEQSSVRVVENELVSKLGTLQTQITECAKLEEAVTAEEKAAEVQLQAVCKQFQEALLNYEQKRAKAFAVRICTDRLSTSHRELEQRLQKVQIAVGDFCADCSSWAAAARSAHDTLQGKIKELVADSEAMIPLPVQAAVTNCTCSCELLDRLVNDKEQEEAHWQQKIDYIDTRCEALEGEMESGSTRRTYDQLSTELAKCMDKGKEVRNKVEDCRQHTASLQTLREKADSQLRSLIAFGLPVEEDEVWKRASNLVDGAYRGRALFHPAPAGMMSFGDRVTMHDVKLLADNPQVQELFSKMVWEEATRLFEKWCSDSCDSPLLRDNGDVMSDVGSTGWLLCESARNESLAS
mmetsp:Transcript_16212/g.37312  ORF Transcript_16212/g.37312 Transcript_16212/m.37312 type:complete len:814 (+) Transcript_16212:109-2550(+)